MDQKQHDREQNKDQKSGEPVQLDKDKKQDDQKHGGQHQGGQQMPGREQQQGNRPQHQGAENR